MPYFVVNKTIDVLSQAGICASKAKVLLLGMAFKRDISDLRDSPAIKVYQILKPRVGQVDYYDPYVPELRVDHQKLKSVQPKASEYGKYDVVVILTDHSAFDYPTIVKNARLIIDTRNAVKDGPKVFKLGARMN